MTVPAFGAIAANAHFGFEEHFFHYSPGDTDITTNNYLDIDLPGFAWPTPDIRTVAALEIHAQVYFAFSSAVFQSSQIEGVMVQSYIPGGDPRTDPTGYLPLSINNSAGVGNPGPILTTPVYARWEGFGPSPPNGYSPKIRVGCGAGAPTLTFRTLSGSWRLFRY